ncbi:MAG: membrane-binding protein [Adhaeribacter sp.]
MKNMIKRGLAWLVVVVSLVQAPAVTEAAVVTKNTSAVPGNTYSTPGARDIIKEIIDVVGLKPRFEVREADVDNAAAVIYNGQRYILYNRQFVAAVNNAVKTDWAAVSILAHEIGHHLNGHTLSRSGSNPQDELEADEFSGFVLRKMGAGLADAQAAMRLLSDEEGSYTHPGRSSRLASISKGWQSANEQIVASTKSSGAIARPVTRPQQQAPVVASAPNRTPVRQTSAQRVVLTQADILRKVTFRAVPGERFYLTKKLSLIHVDDNGRVEVIGKMANTNSRNYPYVLQSSYFDTIYVGNNGVLVTEDGDRIGYLS